MMQTHECYRDMICLTDDNERVFKCYKCLDRDKVFVHKTEVARIISPICEEIAKREVYGEKHDLFVKYSKQQTFSEKEIKEIMEAQKIPDEQKQNPFIGEMRTIIKHQALEISNLKKEVTESKQKHEQMIDSLKKQVQDLKEILGFINNTGPMNQPSYYFSLATYTQIIKYAKQQSTIDVLLKDIDNLIVEQYMLEWALRSGRIDILDLLLQKYFDGVKIELIKYNYKCNHDKEFCRRVSVHNNSNDWQHFDIIHLIYKDPLRMVFNPINFLKQPNHGQEENSIDIVIFDEKRCEYRSHQNAMVMCSLVNYYFSLNIQLRGGNSKMITPDYKQYMTNGQLSTGTMGYPHFKICCEGGKLCIKHN